MHRPRQPSHLGQQQASKKASQDIINVQTAETSPRILTNTVHIANQQASDCLTLEKLLQSPHRVFQLLSGAHKKFHLKFHTLLLAYSLFIECSGKLRLKQIPRDCICLTNLFIAMKYQEIYPPKLENVTKYMQVRISKKKYFEYQVKILTQLDFMLNIPTLDRQLQLLVPNSVSKDILHFCLEMALSSSQINPRYSNEHILMAIQNAITQKVPVSYEAQMVTKYLIIERNNHEAKKGSLYRKYHSHLLRQNQN